jgi:murein DD-endopeptidase MepM/ murein hydrolase activator NlpD
MLKLPVRDVRINQPFGVNYLNFYQQWGLKGHPGIDFSARYGCPIMAAHDGIVSWCGKGKDGGIGIEIWNKPGKFKTFYYHHLINGNKIQKGVKVSVGEIIAKADNTGKYTTGDHEHFELYFVDDNGNTLDKNNGYGGSVDPAPYFAQVYGKDWMKSRSYNRYGRKQEWFAEWKMRFKNPWLHRQLIKRGMSPVWGIEPINAAIYGNWAFEDIINPALYENWGYLTKMEYDSGMRAFR